ncbi:MAG: hypothetical protein PF518_02455 [Spirochaetaceae bacterium]|jgi:epoxyqueuosine reductase|nr:hypothetical protein [Spirochaetaceae bacterium]
MQSIEIKKRIISAGFTQVGFLNDERNRNSIIIAAFPYNLNNAKAAKGVRISPFARNNHYGEAVNRLKKIALFIREEKLLIKKDIRIFCNSQLEEKWFAAKSGLGFYGRNSLIITKEAGSRVILAGLIVPFKLESDKELENATIPGVMCGSCRACINACPTNAIESKGYINRDKCLQSLTTDDRILPEDIMEKWENRLYGCSICQDCCPFNKNPRSKSAEYSDSPNKKRILSDSELKGFIGESVPFEFMLHANDSEMKAFFKGTALSMSWIKYDNLRRNTIISTVFEQRSDLLNELEEFLNHKSLSYAAKWAIKKLTT